MRSTVTSRTAPKFVAFGALALALTAALVVRLRAEDKPQAPAPRPARDLVGTWVLVGTPDNVGEPPAAGGPLKFLSETHWTMTQSDPNTGDVLFHHGGTYTLNGKDYAEKVEYANKNTADLIGKRFEFKVKVEGDTLTQTGVGNPWNQVWKRVK